MYVLNAYHLTKLIHIGLKRTHIRNSESSTQTCWIDIDTNLNCSIISIASAEVMLLEKGPFWAKSDDKAPTRLRNSSAWLSRPVLNFSLFFLSIISASMIACWNATHSDPRLSSIACVCNDWAPKEKWIRHNIVQRNFPMINHIATCSQHRLQQPAVWMCW